MSFKFAARTVLELGKELISSDEVAIYELIKNAVDARNVVGADKTKIRIEAQIVLPASAFRAALENLGAGMSVEDVMRRVRAAMLQSAPPEAAAEFLGVIERRAGSPRRFLLALKSAYARYNWIQVSDEGSGMTLVNLDKVFLTIGTRSRREENIGGGRFLGDKGVGRLSTMRLGERLLVTSGTADQAFWGRLRINWGLFSHDSEVAIEDIAIKPVQGRSKAVGEQGTTVRISALSGDWSAARFEDVMQGRIARMIDPFTGSANDLIVARHNTHRVILPSVPRKLLQAAHATCDIDFFFETDASGRTEPVLEAKIVYGYRNKERTVRYRGVEIFSLAQRDAKRRGKKGHAAFENIRIHPNALTDLGPFKAHIFWYNRLVVQAIDGLTNKQGETRDQITQWSGGPMLYRHGFRILPYGEPGDDWLALDRNAFGEGGFKLNRQQVIGRVLITAGHMALSEQTNRQGLIESDAEAALRKMLMVILHIDMRGLINEADEAETITKRQTEAAALDFRATLQDVELALENLRSHLSADQLPLAEHLDERVHTLVDQCAAAVSKLDKSVAQTVEDREKFLHLAGIGLMTEFIFHELDRAVNHTIRALAGAKGSSNPAALQALDDQLITLQKRVAAFDEVAGERRQSKSTFDLSEAVSSVVEAHANQFARHGITVQVQAGPYRVKAVRGMVVQILENLVSNAVYWLKMQAEYEPGFRPRIWISVDPQLHTLTVEDNGPGVDPSRREAIFQPFVSSKPPNQGRGLGLYISHELADHHGWSLFLDDAHSRQRDGRLSLFVLDMDASK